MTRWRRKIIPSTVGLHEALNELSSAHRKQVEHSGRSFLLTGVSQPANWYPEVLLSIKEMDDPHINEVLGVVRCERCGHRLENEIECPFCSQFQEPARKNILPKWVYLTACFLTSPFSIYFIVNDSRLTLFEKIMGISGCGLWFTFYLVRL